MKKPTGGRFSMGGGKGWGDNTSSGGESARYGSANSANADWRTRRFGILNVLCFTLDLTGPIAVCSQGIKPFETVVFNKAEGVSSNPDPIDLQSLFEHPGAVVADDTLMSFPLGVGAQSPDKFTQEIYLSSRIQHYVRLHALILIKAPDGIDINLRRPDSLDRIACLQAISLAQAAKNERAITALKEKLKGYGAGPEINTGEFIVSVMPVLEADEKARRSRLIYIGSTYDRVADDWKPQSDVEVRLAAHMVKDQEGKEVQGPDTVRIIWANKDDDKKGLKTGLSFQDRREESKDLARCLFDKAAAGELFAQAKRLYGSSAVKAADHAREQRAGASSTPAPAETAQAA